MAPMPMSRSAVGLEGGRDRQCAVTGRRRNDARVLMPPGGRSLTAQGSSVACAWFVWEHGHRGPALIGHIP